MEDSQQEARTQPDPGLKRLLTYTLVALLLSLIAAYVAVTLVIRFFDPGVTGTQ